MCDCALLFLFPLLPPHLFRRLPSSLNCLAVVDNNELPTQERAGPSLFSTPPRHTALSVSPLPAIVRTVINLVQFSLGEDLSSTPHHLQSSLTQPSTSRSTASLCTHQPVLINSYSPPPNPESRCPAVHKPTTSRPCLNTRWSFFSPLVCPNHQQPPSSARCVVYESRNSNNSPDSTMQWLLPEFYQVLPDRLPQAIKAIKAIKVKRQLSRAIKLGTCLPCYHGYFGYIS
ncbi:hypothetical protein R3P38DRAFT_2776150 [Favolaschia claudopus]|uniref:Uncharacterized protein n=1 Tax=Favolaschia claudopus TaxID=2862362 RepID=A0AAW0BPV6_9AGAR